MENVLNFWDNLKINLISYLPQLISALIIVALGLLIAFVVVRITRKAMTKKGVDLSLTDFVCKAVRILIYILTLFSALSAMEISIAGLVAFFSAAAAAIALALKDRLNDIASGIVILFTRPFVTGDFIEFDNYAGFVQKIDIMHTNILTYSRTNVIIPNSVISSSKVNNHTAEPIVRVQVDLPIPYDADIDRVKEVVFGVLKTTEHLVHDETHLDSVNLENSAKVRWNSLFAATVTSRTTGRSTTPLPKASRKRSTKTVSRSRSISSTSRSKTNNLPCAGICPNRMRLPRGTLSQLP